MKFKLIMPLFLGTICSVQASDNSTKSDVQDRRQPITQDQQQQSTVQDQQQLPDQIDLQQVQTKIDQKKAAFLRTNCPRFNIDTQNGLYILDAVLLEPKEFDPIFNQKIDLQQIVFMGMVAEKMLPPPIQNYVDYLLQNQTQNNNQQSASTNADNENSDQMEPEVNHNEPQNNNQQNATMDDLFGFIKASYEFSQKISSKIGIVLGYLAAGFLTGGTVVAVITNPKAAKKTVIQAGTGMLNAGKSVIHGVGHILSTGVKALSQKFSGKTVTQAAVDLAAHTASKAAENAAVAAATVVANTLK